MPKKFNWHQEVIDRATAAISKHASRLIMAGFNFEGWFEWFQHSHPDIFRKYEALPVKLHSAGRKNDSKSMEEFKALCRQYQDAEIWAIDQFVEHLKELNSKKLMGDNYKKIQPETQKALL